MSRAPRGRAPCVPLVAIVTSERTDALQEHWEAENRLWERFKDQPLDRYFAYLADEGRRIAEELNLSVGPPSPSEVRRVTP